MPALKGRSEFLIWPSYRGKKEEVASQPRNLLSNAADCAGGILGSVPYQVKKDLMHMMMDGLGTLDEDEEAILLILEETKKQDPAEF